MLDFASPSTLRHPQRDVTCCAAASEQSIVVTGLTDGTILMWEANTGTLIRKLEGGHDKKINSLSFNKDAVVLASGCEGGNLMWWFLEDVVGSSTSAVVRRRVLEGHEGSAITACCFAPNTQIMASGAKDCDVILWGNMGRPIHRRLRGHTNWVTSLVFSPDASILASGSFDHTVVLWDALYFGVIRTIRNHEAPVTALAMSIEGSVIASGDNNGVVLLCRTADGICLRVLRGHDDMITGVKFIDSLGILVSSSLDGTVKVWELRGRCLKSFRAHGGSAVTSIVVSQLDEMLVTTGEDYCCRIFPYVWRDENS